MVRPLVQHGLLNQSSAQVIDGSLKFENGSSTYLTRTPGSAGNRSNYTGSVWVKRTEFAPEGVEAGNYIQESARVGEWIIFPGKTWHRPGVLQSNSWRYIVAADMEL